MKPLALIAIASLGQKTTYLKRALGTGLSLEASKGAENRAQRTYEIISEPIEVAGAHSFSEEGGLENQP